MGRLTKEQIEFIKNNVEKKTNREMAKELDCNVSTISNWRKKLGIDFSSLHDFSEYNDYICENYDKKTSKALAQEIGCSKEYVKKIWYENNLKGKTNRSYYSNFNYFNEINSPNKAYLLGVICSDGCIYKRDNHEGMWQISIDKNDYLWLEDIKKIIESNNPLSFNNSTVTLSIVSQKMYNDLNNIGIIPKKTYTMDIEKVFDAIPQEYHIDFIHGYFDGDGSITVKKIPSKSKVQIALPERHLAIFQKILLNYHIESSWTEDNRFEKYTIPFGNLVINGASNKYCLLKLFDLHNTISLTRKTELCHQLCEQIQSNITNRSENKTAVIKWEELLESLRR